MLTTDAPDFETLNLPTDFGQDHWNLMLSLTASDTFQMNARWSINTAWQTLTGQPVVNRLPTQQHFLMYVRSAYRIQPAQRLMLERCCGQTQAYCVLHKQLLLRQAQGVHIPCSVPTCTCFLFWCCPHNFGDRNQCSFGLRRKHFKLTIPDVAHETFTVGKYGPALPAHCVPPASKHPRLHDVHNDHVEEDDGDDHEDITFALEFHPPVEGVEDPQDIYPIGNTNHMLNVCPLTTSADITPLVMTENYGKHSMQIITIYGYPKFIYGYPKFIYGYPKFICGYPKFIYGYP